MEGQEGSQQPQLVLADKLFLLRQPDVPDIEKVRFKDEVFTHVKDNGNPHLFPNSIQFPFHHSLKSNNVFLSFFFWRNLCFSDMVPLYETLAADSVLDMDRALLDSMRAKIDDELKKLDEKSVTLSPSVNTLLLNSMLSPSFFFFFFRGLRISDGMKFEMH